MSKPRQSLAAVVTIWTALGLPVPAGFEYVAEELGKIRVAQEIQHIQTDAENEIVELTRSGR